MLFCDWSTIRLSLTPKQLDVRDLRTNTHKLEFQHPSNWTYIRHASTTTNNPKQTEVNQQREDKQREDSLALVEVNPGEGTEDGQEEEAASLVEPAFRIHGKTHLWF